MCPPGFQVCQETHVLSPLSSDLQTLSGLIWKKAHVLHNYLVQVYEVPIGKYTSTVNIVEGIKVRKQSERGKKEPEKQSVMEAKGEGHVKKEGEAAVSTAAE